ncbi:cellobiose dehydrogenase [Drepanopeziza brunnea f. sp. 'multigermtubi' MB_m1]|uniref:Cellobiose dehydrogenase n=1 Tax=Marssonina brunnea f. sp. multigermtubi (strain MB_m1) TaxID=1072389 RepID=K1XX94_MARBU|nr:cellobiose dehydrogenase [Drepanopeziza brunnea f. sp. 'multigermtubi' MB_m1]EKD17414.1 cellobiose dehydrogenase [Drepanopeziza brunnea f. sp. 'multigermtubi' MB_m1]
MLFTHFSPLALLVAAAAADWSTQQWDAIVVGAGPAGIIVASRLAAAGHQTLLLEGGAALSYGVTGGDLNSRRPSWLAGTSLTRVDVPGLYKSIFSDGGGLTCPGTQVAGYGGCTIGGSSAINAGLFFEPPASDYDLYFPAGWKSADMESATTRLYATQSSTNLTSQDGTRYLQTGYTAARKWLVDGLGFKDVDINAQANDKTQVFGYPIFDYSNGQRGGPVTNYLQSALKRTNFNLQSGARVTRVERTGSKVTGVTVSVGGVDKVVNLTPKGRVILSGGALQSPSLLMYSGIGDPAELTKLQNGNKLASNMAPAQWINSTAVGSGLFDNPNTFIELSGPSIESYTYSYDNPPAGDRDLYLQKRSGPYTFASQTAVFWDTIKHPDGSVTGLQGTIDSSGYADFNDQNTITLNVYGTSGLKSTGRVVLDASLVPGPDGSVYYSNPRDAQDIASWIHKLFQKLPDSGLTPRNIPQQASQADIEKYITTFSPYARGQVNHWTSSCRIGTCVDKNTVVIGTTNLHVVDSSIVAPLTVNPQFGVMVAAERASELILALDGKKIV